MEYINALRVQRCIERKRNRQRERRDATSSIVMDSAATSTVIRSCDAVHVHVLPTQSTKVFYNANGSTSEASNQAKLQYNMQAPATEANMVPSLAMNLLLSTSKLADANYITIFTKDEVQVFDGGLAKVNVNGAVMKGWRCPTAKLWRVPIKPMWTNTNTDTTLLSQEATNLIMAKQHTNPHDFVNSVYKLPNTEQVVAWYHAAVGYPTNATWLKAVDNLTG